MGAANAARAIGIHYEDIYQAIGFATEFQQALAEANLGMTSPAEGVKRYVTQLVQARPALPQVHLSHAAQRHASFCLSSTRR